MLLPAEECQLCGAKQAAVRRAGRTAKGELCTAHQAEREFAEQLDKCTAVDLLERLGVTVEASSTADKLETALFHSHDPREALLNLVVKKSMGEGCSDSLRRTISSMNRPCPPRRLSALRDLHSRS